MLAGVCDHYITMWEEKGVTLLQNIITENCVCVADRSSERNVFMMSNNNLGHFNSLVFGLHTFFITFPDYIELTNTTTLSNECYRNK